MFGRRLYIIAIVILLLAHTCRVTSASAKDYFLTIGGGAEVTSNQLSLERNVLLQQSVLEQKRPDHPDLEIWFADGNDASRDVQYRDPQFEKNCPPARRLMAELLGDPDSMDLIYRNNEIPGLTGPANLKLVKERFRTLAGELKSGDRVIVYATGHGGRAKGAGRGRRGKPSSSAYNTSLYFWNSESVSASEFSEWLDRFPPDVQVVLVMVQCFAGGFSHTIFQHADAKAELSPHERCGFFAQMHDRAAAGCTPDASEADFEEYSGCFWGALAGKSRDGKPVDSADYDKNGQVSFAEAHAYAIIQSETIDVPVRTSGAFLRRYSRAGKPTEKSASSDQEKQLEKLSSDTSVATNQSDMKYMEMSGPISILMEICRSDHRAILEQLPNKCELGGQSTIDDVQQKLQQEKKKSAILKTILANASRNRRDKLKQLKEDVVKQWPELKAEYAPLAFELAGDRGPEFVNRVHSMPDYEAWRDASAKEGKCGKALLEAERRTARLERLLQTCEDVVLAANLPRIASPEIAKRYQQLIAMEESTLTDSVKPVEHQ